MHSVHLVQPTSTGVQGCMQPSKVWRLLRALRVTGGTTPPCGEVHREVAAMSHPMILGWSPAGVQVKCSDNAVHTMQGFESLLTA